MRVSSARVRDWLLLLVCNLIWASQFVLVKVVQEVMGPVFAVFFPMLLAAALLLWSSRREAPSKLQRGDIWRFIVLGLFGQLVAQLFITWGVRLSLASNAAVLSLAMPVCTAVMARIFLGERMTAVRWASFVLCIGGVVACSLDDLRGFDLAGSAYLLGNLLIFLSVNGSAFYNSYGKVVLERHSPMRVLLYSYYALLVFLLPVVLRLEPEAFLRIPAFSAKVWLAMALLAGLQYYLSMVIFLRVLTRLDATQAAVSNYLIPFFGVVIAAVTLGERMTAPMWAGGALGLVSTFLATVFDGPPSRHATLEE